MRFAICYEKDENCLPVQQFKISSLASLETRTFGIISLISLFTAATTENKALVWHMHQNNGKQTLRLQCSILYSCTFILRAILRRNWSIYKIH